MLFRSENLFCKAFDARNLSRGDISADASKAMIGFGIKTFLHKNGRSFEKVAEFNSDHQFFSSLSAEEKVLKVAGLRNERIETTKHIAGISDIIYHCVTRNEKGIFVYEEPMRTVQLDTIKNLKFNKGIIHFEDAFEEIGRAHV